MTSPKLYIFIGAPGAGKTTIAQAIAETTGARHLWADAERHKLFEHPTHSQEESNKLYEQLNNAADYLLEQGKSVVYDTNFNFYKDRALMHKVASKHGADTVVVWVTTPNEVARKRAVGQNIMRNGYPMSMTSQQFDDIVNKLEPPRKNEKVIKIDASQLDKSEALRLLGIHGTSVPT